MMTFIYSATLWALFVLPFTSAIPAPTPAPTPAPDLVARASTTIVVPPLTIAPGFVVTTAVIDSSTYPIIELGGQGGYSLSKNNNSVTGLLGITLANNYSTLPGGQVYPVIDLVVAEADTESFTIPGVLTFFDGGLVTTGAQPTDVLCTAEVGGSGVPASCSGLAGRVTGTLLGVPFSNTGGIAEDATIPASSGGTAALSLSAGAIAAEGPRTDSGQISVAIQTAPSYTSAGVGASGDGDSLGAVIAIQNGTVVVEVVVCVTAALGICSTLVA